MLPSVNDLPADPPLVEVAFLAPDTQAEGPGRRYAVWVQGCPLRCRGCCNPLLLPFGPGARRATAAELLAEALAGGTEGLSLLGGEPFAHAAALAPLALGMRAAGRSVMVYTGFLLEDLQARAEAGETGVGALLGATDLLVDGPYEADLRTTTRRWIGSTNQRLHFLSGRYRPEDPVFAARNTVELRLEGGRLTMVGWPLTGARSPLEPR